MVALLSSDSLSDRETGVDMSVNTSTAFFAAIWNESEMVVGWIPTCGVRETYQSLVMSTEHVYTYMCVYYYSTFRKKFLTGIQKATSQNDNSGSSISSFHILGL